MKPCIQLKYLKSQFLTSPSIFIITQLFKKTTNSSIYLKCNIFFEQKIPLLKNIETKKEGESLNKFVQGQIFSMRQDRRPMMYTTFFEEVYKNKKENVSKETDSPGKCCGKKSNFLILKIIISSLNLSLLLRREAPAKISILPVKERTILLTRLLLSFRM